MSLKKTITTALALTLAALALGGCSNDTSKERFTIKVKDVTLTYRAENAAWSLLSITQAKDKEYVSLLSSTSTGKFTTQPDPNSIDSAGGMLGSIIDKVLERK